MMTNKRLIDANALRDGKFTVPLQNLFSMGWTEAIEAVMQNAPTVDAVEVVRCKNCKHYLLPQGFCSHDRHEYQTQAVWQEDDDFCSYGERRDAK